MLSDEDFGEPDEPPEPDEPVDFQDYDDDDNDSVVVDDSSDGEEFVEFDLSGRYGRYSEVLGKGAMKTVYRAYDLADCNEVAWNKARPQVECSDEQACAVQREVHILQGLDHQAILKLYSAWEDINTGDTNFITELCSTTLLEYRLKHKHISRKAVKNWGRQILGGLAHLHKQNPPIIHRDLKCENILVKCRSNTALRIGDFGSATFLDETQHMHTLVGTPEFMAPEMFQEDYNELVDVYSFGMCMLELLTRECPYSECKSLGQIYKKVINGEKPKALQKVTDVQALRLINQCLLPACKRPSASELLADPFLQCKEGQAMCGQSMKSSISMPNLMVSTNKIGVKNMLSAHGDASKIAMSGASTRTKKENADRDLMVPQRGKRAFCTKSLSFRRTYRVTGRVEDQYTLRLKIRIQESSRSCDIDFPFDLRFDSPRSVAEEMVRTLDYSESDLETIAGLIREEILALMPNMEEKFPENGAGLKSQDLMLQHGLNGDSEAINARFLSSAQASRCILESSLDGLNCTEDQVSKKVDGESLLSCEGYGSAEENEEVDFTSSSTDRSSMVTASICQGDSCTDQGSDSFESSSENGDLGVSKFQRTDLCKERELENSFFCPSTSGQATLVSSGAIEKALLGELCALSDTG